MRDPRIEARALTGYWLQTRQLPNAKTCAVEEEDVCYELGYLEGRFEDLPERDNSFHDFDERRGHLLVNEDSFNGRPARIAYEGNHDQGRLDVLWLCEEEGYLQETSILDGRHVDILTVNQEKGGLYLTARHIDRFNPGKAVDQCLHLPWPTSKSKT